MSVESRVELNLSQTQRNIEKAQKQALKVAGEKVAERLRANVPVGESNKHLRDNIVVSNYNDTTGEVKVGFTKEVAWRAHFVEVGTIYQRPQNFIQRTEQEMKAKVMDIIQQEISRRLGL